MEPVKISIIIASRNREAILWVSINKAVEAIDGKPAEIIVVNDGDLDLTPPQQVSGKIKYFKNPSRGVSSARNYGASKASGEILFFVDDDMWINAAALDWIMARMSDKQSREAVYNINWEYPLELYKKLSRNKVGRFLLQANYNCMWGRMHEHGAQPGTGVYPFNSIASCSLVMQKNIFETLGGYNEQLIFQGEDIDLSNRLRLLSIPVFAVFDVTLFHNHQDRLEISGFLARLSNGYNSEFKAVKAGIIRPLSSRRYNKSTRAMFELFRFSEAPLVSLFKIIPNHSFFKPPSNRLIGLLSGLARYKEWRAVFIGKDK